MTCGVAPLESVPLAEAIAAEWAEAPENFTPDDVPLTRLVATAQERVRTHRAAIIDQLAAYGRNDLLCYRAADSTLRATEDIRCRFQATGPAFPSSPSPSPI